MKRKRDDNEAMDDDKASTCSWLVPCAQREYINQDSSATSDLIGQLPEHLLATIMSGLTLRNVVQASVISHYFRNTCCSLSRLRFDTCNMLSNGIHDCMSVCEEPKHCCGDYRHKFVHAVDQFLKFYQATKLMTFQVSFCLGSDDKEFIDRWIRFALGKDVCELSLALYCANTSIKLNWDKWTESKYVLSGELFGGLSNLRCLRLVACRFGKDFSVQFNHLIKLILHHMPLVKHDLQRMLLCMPKLKSLLIHSCTLPAKLSFGCVPHLKILCIRYCWTIREIELRNADLDAFICSGPRVVKCNLSGAPNLTTIGYAAHEAAVRYMFSHLSEDYPLLKDLCIYTHVDWVSCIPEGVRTFKHLKDLKMCFSKRTRFDLLKLIRVLCASPFLCKLELMTNCCQDVEQGTLELGEFVHQYLEDVEIGGQFGISSQIEFIVYLLKRAPALKKLTLLSCRLDFQYALIRRPWLEDKRSGILEQLKAIWEGRFGCDTYKHNVEITFKP